MQFRQIHVNTYGDVSFLHKYVSSNQLHMHDNRYLTMTTIQDSQPSYVFYYHPYD